MTRKELKEYYNDQLILVLVSLVVFLIFMGIVFYLMITPHIIISTINDCTREIVGNCIVK